MKNNVSEYLIVLDLRSINLDQESPWNVVERSLQGLPNGGLLKIVTEAKAEGFGELLVQNECRFTRRAWSDSHVDYEIITGNTPEVLDLTELEPPGPMEKILTAGVHMKSGDLLFARVPRVPTMLFPHLEARDLAWSVHEEPDQTALLVIRKES